MDSPRIPSFWLLRLLLGGMKSPHLHPTVSFQRRLGCFVMLASADLLAVKKGGLTQENPTQQSCFTKC